MFRTKDLASVRLVSFIRKKGYFKADCYKFKALMNSKKNSEGKSLAFLTFEPHLVDVPLNSRWINTGHLFMLQIYYKGSKGNSGHDQTRLMLSLERKKV